MSLVKTAGQYLIPPHAIFRPDVNQSKIRVVFDTSKNDYRCSLLNSGLCEESKVQKDIDDILMRFRLNQFAFTTDICKMYHQIIVLSENQPLQYILWCSSPHDKLLEYELNTVK